MSERKPWYQQPVRPIHFLVIGSCITLCCGGPFLCFGLLAMFMGDPGPESGMFVIKNRSGTKVQIFHDNAYICTLKPAMIGCGMALYEYEDEFTAKMIMNGKFISKECKFKYQPRMIDGLTTLVLDSHGEVKVESIVERE